ncbi:MAG: hypothetical protein ACKO5A_06440 [Actinomycetota bacterium]
MELETLIDIDVPEDLSSLSMVDLRMVRNQLQDVENGLSFARRMVQGRLDTVAAEVERRTDGSGVGSDDSVVERLLTALAAGTRSSNLPRPPQELEPPGWVDALLVDLDAIVGPTDLGRLSELDAARLNVVTEELASIERQVSSARREVHERIDRLQAELVERYRSGASVDDLLP